MATFIEEFSDWEHCVRCGCTTHLIKAIIIGIIVILDNRDVVAMMTRYGMIIRQLASHGPSTAVPPATQEQSWNTCRTKE